MNRLLTTLYGYRFLSDCMVIYALFAVLLAENGLSTLQISILLSVWAATALLFEIPSGVWADKYPRHTILAYAEIIRAAGWMIWLIFPTFTGFLLGFVCWGLKNAMVSGTFQALTYDELAKVGKQDRYVKTVGTAESLSLIAIVISTLAASQVVRLGFDALIIASICTGLLSAIAIATIPTAKRIKAVAPKYSAILRQGIQAAVTERTVLYLLLFGAFVGTIFGALGNYTTLFIKDAGWDNSSNSLLYALITLLLAGVSYIAYLFKRISMFATIGVMAVAGILLVCSTLGVTQTSVLLLALYMGLFKLVIVVYDGKLQRYLEAQTRATVTSVKGLIEQVGNIGVYLLFGSIAGIGGRTIAFRYFGFIILAVCLLLGVALLRARSTNKLQELR